MLRTAEGRFLRTSKSSTQIILPPFSNNDRSSASTGTSGAIGELSASQLSFPFERLVKTTGIVTLFAPGRAWTADCKRTRYRDKRIGRHAGELSAELSRILLTLRAEARGGTDDLKALRAYAQAFTQPS
jgi:hypothetical protein